VLGDDLVLPTLQDDAALVLPSRTVLRKQTRPVFPSNRGHQAAGYDARMGSAVRLHRAHQVGDVRVQDWIGEVVADVKAVDASPTEGDVTVPEVPTEELGVRAGVEPTVAAAGTGCREVLLSAGHAAALIQAPPPTDRLDRYAVQSGIPGVSHP
jgi:hypothetical protein